MIVVDGRMLSRPQCHGIARVVVSMLQALPPAADGRVRVLVDPLRPRRFELSDRFETVPVAASVVRPWEVRELRSVLHDASVLFAPYHPLAPLTAPCPVVVQVHDCIFESDPRLIGSPVKQRAYVAKTALTLRQAAHVVTPSAATAADLVARYRQVPPVTVCRNGVAPLASPGTSPVSGRYVLGVGALRPHKNHGVLVDALPSLPADVRLVLVGSHDPRAPYDVVARAAALGVADRVTVLSEVSDAELVALYRGASVFAFPSVAEGFGLPVLEAMCAGAPVVASAVPAVAETAGGAADLVSPHDPAGWVAALQRVLSDPAHTDDLVARGGAVARASGWEHGAHALWDVLSRA